MIHQNRDLLQWTLDQEGQSTLVLEKLDLQDQGVYRCEAECGPVIRTRDVLVDIYCESDAPNITVTNIPLCLVSYRSVLMFKTK